eukprot:TRINITY_DN784_c0_g1_i4.p1 TRINITY_DN784_c0_g1~~TRINITY_DN784_c0_g1_i4.p1  ORF type:complete len:529 (-),score=128.63 TRINITY_DN784_c0_g1_i4:255-1841(-)
MEDNTLTNASIVTGMSVVDDAKQHLNDNAQKACTQFEVQSLNDSDALALASSHQRNIHHRNVILVGRSRAGKSMLLEVLKDPFQVAPPVSFYAQTKEPFVRSLLVSHCKSVAKAHKKGEPIPRYLVRVVDTPGLFERRANAEDGSQSSGDDDAWKESARSNAEIRKLVFSLVQRECREINLICMVCSFEAGVSAEDVRAIEQLVKEFQGANFQFVLLVTRCERKRPAKRKELEAQIRAVPELRTIFGLCENIKESDETSEEKFPTILFSGGVSGDDVARADYKAVTFTLEHVLSMRSALLKFITRQCHRSFPTDRLGSVVQLATDQKQALEQSIAASKEENHQLSQQTAMLQQQLETTKADSAHALSRAAADVEIERKAKAEVTVQRDKAIQDSDNAHAELQQVTDEKQALKEALASTKAEADQQSQQNARLQQQLDTAKADLAQAESKAAADAEIARKAKAEVTVQRDKAIQDLNNAHAELQQVTDEKQALKEALASTKAETDQQSQQNARLQQATIENGSGRRNRA